MAFKRFGKLNAASAHLTQLPSGLRNLFLETRRTKTLLGVGLSSCIQSKYTLRDFWQIRRNPIQRLRQNEKILATLQMHFLRK